MLYGILYLLALASIGRINAVDGKSFVTTEAGTIVGQSKTVVVRDKSVQIDVFLGIPYGKSPTGDLRFRKPQPVEKFNAPYEALQYGASCPQTKFDMFPLPDVMSEDCLFLNVFVPSQPSQESSGRAVMVWIHGGALAMGNSDLYGGSSISASGDVIIVTINYRIGLLGFFSTGDEHAPGNMGFWDQRLALQWVQANIEAFGGDKNRVTIFGESAGGVSVSMQSLYPKNEGLFHRIIAESGAATTMAVSEPGEAKESALYVGEQFNCSIETSETIVECLRGIDFNTFLTVLLDLQMKPEAMMKMKLYTTVDSDFVRIHPKYLTTESSKGLVDEVQFYRSIDNLSGFNSREGAMIASFLAIKGDPEEYEPTRDDMVDAIMPVLGMAGRIYPAVLNDMIKSEYTNWNLPDDPFNVRDEIVKFMGDLLFEMPAIEFARLHANSTSDVNSYLYYFTATPSWRLIPTPSWVEGANHGDEISYVFAFDKEVMTVINGTLVPEDWETDLAARMIAYWANFGKTG